MKRFTDKINESVDVNKLPTANEWLETFGADADDMFYRYSVEEAMIEFAKLHVEAALKAATHVLDVNADADWIEYPTDERILNAYPLTNIK
jgi:hypothetical protein